MYTVKDIYYIPNFFTDREIDAFLLEHEAFLDDDWDKAEIQRKEQGVYDPSIRKTKIKHLKPSSKDLLLMKFVYGVVEANHTKFKKNIQTFFLEPINFLKYTDDFDHFKIHKDVGNKITEKRQLSCIVFLSKLTDYQGGGLVFYGNEKKEGRFRLHTEKGTLVVFPSEMFHEVTPVTKGTRFSLVMWVG